jgi:hypothetical protein
MSNLSKSQGEIKQEWSGLQQLMSKIPGFSGYMERESRRAADKLLRDTLVRRFEEQWRRLPDLQRELMSAGLIEYTDDLESATKKLQTVIDRLRTAKYGYAGFFDAVKVNEAELDRLYAYDNRLSDNVARVQSAIDAVASAISANEGVHSAIANLNVVGRETNEAITRREDVLSGSLQA